VNVVPDYRNLGTAPLPFGTGDGSTVDWFLVAIAFASSGTTVGQTKAPTKATAADDAPL